MDAEDVRSAQQWNAWVVPKGFSASDRDASLGSQSLRRARAEARRYSLGKLLRHVQTCPWDEKRSQMLFWEARSDSHLKSEIGTLLVFFLCLCLCPPLLPQGQIKYMTLKTASMVHIPYWDCNSLQAGM